MYAPRTAREPRLQLDDAVAGGRAALEVDRHRQAGDVTGERLDVHRQRGDAPAEPLRADPQAVDRLQQLGLQLGRLGVGVHAADLSQQRPLGQPAHRVEGAADADADDHRRAGVGPRQLHRLQHEALDPLAAVGRGQHGQPAHVLGPAAFGQQRQPEAVARHQPGVDDRRGVVAGVAPGGEGPLDHRLAQVADVVGLAHPAVDRLLEGAADDVHVLADVGEDDDGAGVLAHRHAVALGDGDVLQELLEHLAPERGDLALASQGEGAADVLAQHVVGLEAEVSHRCGDLVDVNLAHRESSSGLASRLELRLPETRPSVSHVREGLPEAASKEEGSESEGRPLFRQRQLDLSSGIPPRWLGLAGRRAGKQPAPVAERLGQDDPKIEVVPWSIDTTCS